MVSDTYLKDIDPYAESSERTARGEETQPNLKSPHRADDRGRARSRERRRSRSPRARRSRERDRDRKSHRKEERRQRYRSRSRSRSRTRSRSRSRSRSRDKERRNRSPARARSPEERRRSPTRSRGQVLDPEEEQTARQFARVIREAQRRELPRKESRYAPVTWDGQPANLPQFFRELEDLFEDYRVEGRERVTVLTRYVDTVPEGMIRELDGYLLRDYNRLKAEILDLVGQYEEKPMYRTADLDALIRTSSMSAFKSEKAYQITYLKFLQMSQYLMRNRKLQEEERDFKFWGMFDDKTRKRLRNRLEIKMPNHSRSVPYPMKEVHSAALYILDDNAFDRRDTGDSRTWLERTRANHREAESSSRGKATTTSRRRRSPSPVSPSSDSSSSSSRSRSNSPKRQDSRVRWGEREKPAHQTKSTDDPMFDLLEKMAKLAIDDPEYQKGYAIIESRYPSIAATLRRPSAGTYPGPASLRPQYPAGCFYCAREGCRMASCPVLREHMTAGLVKPDPGNPKFVVYKDNSRLIAYPMGGRAADVEARVKLERERATQPALQASMIRADFEPEEVYWDEHDEEVQYAFEASRAKGTTRSGKPYDRVSGAPGDKRRGKARAEAADVPPPEAQVAGPSTGEPTKVDETMTEVEPKRTRAPAQYRYSSQAEAKHSDETYMNKVLDLPLSGTDSAIRLRDLIGSSLTLRKGLVEYLRTQRVPVESQVTPAIVAALGVPAPLFHSRLERFVVRVSGRDMVALKDEGSEINLLSSHARRVLGLPLDVHHRINMEGVNPGARRSEGLCENVILTAGGVEMRVHLHVFDNSPFDMLLGQPWKAQYMLAERRREGMLEMVVCDYRDTDRQVSVVLRDPSDPDWESRLDALQLPRPRRQPVEPEHHSHTTNIQSRFDRQPEGVSPARGGEEEEDWRVAKQAWVNSAWSVAKAKYKPVARKVRPVDGVLPDEARTIRKFPENPLSSLPEVPHNPPSFVPGERLTAERLASLQLDREGFLWPEEQRLFAHILRSNESALAFDESEKGRFRDDYFSPYRIATVAHEPWQEKPIPIGPGMWPKVLALVKQKVSNGTYEWSQSSYRGRIFPVLKKDGSPRIVHDMQKLNAVTIRDSTLPPNVEDVVESFAGRSCYSVFDIFVGYDNRTLALESRDMTSFLVPGYGLLRLTSLPMGATNAMAEFQACMTFILQDEIPDTTCVFVDDCGIKGPPSRYELGESYEVISENPGIRRFVWEHALCVNRVLHRIGHAGATVSALKLQLAVSEVHLLGSVCTYEGRLPDNSKVSKIVNWVECETVAEVRGFLGTCGVVRAWIKGYSIVARPLTALLRKGRPWQWGEQEREAMQRLKQLVSTAPCLAPLNCATDAETILAVDSSSIAVGFVLYQFDTEGRRRPVRFGSLTFNERESRYSQPKLELYGLYRALRKWRPYVVSVRNLVVEVDAKYIRGMLNSPELVQNAVVGRWVEDISTYPFQLRHVRAADHSAPDGLSRRRRAEEDTSSDESEREVEGDSRVVLVARIDGWAGEPALAMNGQLVSSLEPELEHIWAFLESLTRPAGLSKNEARSLARKAQRFFLVTGRLWRRRDNGQHQQVLPLEQRERAMSQAHDELGHKGVWSTSQQLALRVWWPSIERDVAEYVKTCRRCQMRNPQGVHLPIQVSIPQTPFRRLHGDVVFLPPAQGYIAAILVRDDLSGYLEGRRLKRVTAKTIAAFLWEDVLTRWGAVIEIVTDNGNEFRSSAETLLRRYNVNQIRISAYNKQANGVVERGHRTFREALLRTCEQPNSWPDVFHATLWAERSTVRKATGYSPYYLAHGTHPLLPFDVTDSTFLFGEPEPLSTVELVARRARMLAKSVEAVEKARDRLTRSRYQSKAQFERAHANNLRLDPFPPGTPVLVRNSRFDSDMNAKSHDRWLGPYIVVRIGRKGAYRLAELDGAVLAERIAAARVIEFFPRQELRLRPEKVLGKTGWKEIQEELESDSEEEETSNAGRE